MLYGTVAPTLVVLLIFVYLCWLDGCCGPRPPSDTPHDEPGACSPPGQIVAESRCLRLSIFLVSVTLISTCAVITLVSGHKFELSQAFLFLRLRDGFYKTFSIKLLKS